MSDIFPVGVLLSEYNLYIFNAVNIGPIHPEKIVKAAIVAIDDLLGG